MKTITLHLYDNGTLDTWVQEEGGPTVSFDPLQLPAEMAAAMGDVASAALAKAEEADTARKEADTARKASEDRFASVDGESIKALQADNQAKDANIQALLARVAELEEAVTP